MWGPMTLEFFLLLSLALLPSHSSAASDRAKTEENPINAAVRELKGNAAAQAAVADRFYGFLWKDYVESSVKEEKDNELRLRAAVRAWVGLSVEKDAARLGVAEFDHLLQLKAEDPRAKALVENLKAWSGNSDPAEGFIYSGSYLSATKTARWIDAFLTDAVAQSQKIFREAPRAAKMPTVYDPSKTDD